MNPDGEENSIKKPRNDSRNIPKLILTLERTVNKPVSNRVTLAVFAKKDNQFQKEDGVAAPLYFTDVQSLLLAVAFPQAQITWPRWCRVIKPIKIEKIVVVLCDRVTAEDVDRISEQSGLPFVPSFLKVNIDVPSPHSYNCLPEKELLSIPLQFLTAAARDRSMKHLSIKDGAPISENALSAVDVKMENTPNIPPKESVVDVKMENTPNNPPKESVVDVKMEKTINTPCNGTAFEYIAKPLDRWNLSLSDRDAVPRTLLLLGPSQLSMENYPLPGEHSTQAYLATHDVYEDVTDASPMLSIDCEMVVTENRPPMELARITVMNEAHEVVYDSLVKPYKPVINYLTSKSGMTKKLLKDVTKTLKDVQMDMMEMIPKDAILVGQSLNCDLRAMQMYHPYCIDTSVIYNLSGVRHRKPGLKLLTKKFLKRDIQNNKFGHCSAEDSSAALELVQLKLQKSLEFGDVVSGQWNHAELELTKSDDEEAGPPKKRLRLEGEGLQTNRLTSPQGPGSSGEDSPCADSCGRVPDEGAGLSDAVRRHRKFLSVHGTSPWCRPFFSLLNEAGISCALLDDEERCKASFETEALENLSSLVVSRKDRRRISALEKAVADHKWTFLRLHQHVEQEEDREKRVSRLRNYISKIDDLLPPHALLMVVVSGHPDRPKESARCYSGLKPKAKEPQPDAPGEVDGTST